MYPLEIIYLEIDEMRRHDEQVDAAFDILFEQVLHDHAPPWVGAKSTG